MSDESHICPKCQSPHPYPDGNLWTCPECTFEFNPQDSPGFAAPMAEASVIKDSNGNTLMDGDTVTVIKELKVKGSSQPIKVGTKVKNIRLNFESSDGHDISCKIPGFGSMGLKSEFVKKV